MKTQAILLFISQSSEVFWESVRECSLYSQNFWRQRLILSNVFCELHLGEFHMLLEWLPVVAAVVSLHKNR